MRHEVAHLIKDDELLWLFFTFHMINWPGCFNKDILLKHSGWNLQKSLQFPKSQTRLKIERSKTAMKLITIKKLIFNQYEQCIIFRKYDVQKNVKSSVNNCASWSIKLCYYSSIYFLPKNVLTTAKPDTNHHLKRHGIWEMISGSTASWLFLCQFNSPIWKLPWRTFCFKVHTINQAFFVVFLCFDSNIMNI